MLSPLSKTQNSFMKAPPTDRDISGGFTFVDRNRPPTFDKHASGQRPTIRNQIDTWNDSVFSVESTHQNYAVTKPSHQLLAGHMVGIHGHPQERLTKQLGATNSHFTHRSDPFQNSDLKDISRITSLSKERTYDSGQKTLDEFIPGRLKLNIKGTHFVKNKLCKVDALDPESYKYLEDPIEKKTGASFFTRK